MEQSQLKENRSRICKFWKFKPFKQLPSIPTGQNCCLAAAQGTYA